MTAAGVARTPPRARSSRHEEAVLAAAVLSGEAAGPFIDRAFNRDDRWNPSFTCEKLLAKVIGP